MRGLPIFFNKLQFIWQKFEVLKVIDLFEKTRDLDVIAEFARTLFGKRVLEVGCGTGKRTKLFVETGCDVTAIDIIDTRKSEFTTGYDFIMADGKDLPFKDNTFDAIVSFDVIEHIDRDKLFLSESYRVSKKGGILILGTPNRNRLSHQLRQVLGKKITYPLEIGKGCVHLREYTMEELRGLVTKAGFRVIQEENVWLGLVGLFGFKCFPTFFNKYVQCLIVFAAKEDIYGSS